MARARVADALTPHLALQRDGGEAMHRQLYSTFRSAILDGVFAPGTRLPSTRALSQDLGVSRTTVLQAFERLVSEGYATARSGAGTRVATTLNTTTQRRSTIRVERSEPSAPDRPPRLSRAMHAILDEFKKPHPPARMVPFSLGLPAIDDFPVELWSRLIGRLWRTRARDMLGFADLRGYPPFREAVAQYVMAARGVRCTAEQIVVVNGTLHGVSLMAQVLLDPGDAVWVEEPGWRPVRAALRATEAQLVRVPVDEHGLDVREAERRAPHARLVFVTPSYQAPLGVALTLERRLALLDWAAREDAWILEDDYNGEYRYDTDPIPAVHSLDREGRVIYIGSFSKSLAPGLRVGYLVLPPSLVEPVMRARLASDMNTPVAGQAVLAEFIAGGHFARHIRRTRDLYRERQKDLLELVPEILGDLLEVRPAPAGMRLVGLLPRGVDSRAIGWAAAEQGLSVTPLSPSAPASMTDGREGLLLGYGAFDRETTAAALRVLGDVIRANLPGAARSGRVAGMR
ncbi:MAG: PLP-dependent aminotransferase family protein [Gemmatimonadaceae bacterium]